MKWIITLLCIVQFVLAAAILDGSSWNSNGKIRVGVVLIVIAIVNTAHAWSRGDSLLALWVKRKRLEQEKKIKELQQ